MNASLSYRSIVRFESFEPRQFLSAAPTLVPMAAVVNKRPLISKLTAAPNPVTKGANVTLVASGVSDPDGSVAKVEFYRDSNGNGIFEKLIDQQIGLDGSPRKGWNCVYNTATCPSGWNTFFARTRDNLGEVSKPAVASCFVIGKVNFLGEYSGTIQFSKGGSGVSETDVHVTQQNAAVSFSGTIVNGGFVIPFTATIGKNYNLSFTLSGPVQGSGTGTYNVMKGILTCTFSVKSLDDGSTHAGTLSVRKE